MAFVSSENAGLKLVEEIFDFVLDKRMGMYFFRRLGIFLRKDKKLCLRDLYFSRIFLIGLGTSLQRNSRSLNIKLLMKVSNFSISPINFIIGTLPILINKKCIGRALG
jgi:hypothetical protein